MSKKCIRCGEVLPLDRFYSHPAMRDGHLNKCIECTKEDAKAHRIANPEHYKEYESKRGGGEKRKRLNSTHVKKWREGNPEKYRAQNAVNNAVRDKKITKPTECQICGKAYRLIAHHRDYSKPLDVLWICQKCHRDLHHE